MGGGFVGRLFEKEMVAKQTFGRIMFSEEVCGKRR